MRRCLVSWRVSARRNPIFHKISTSDSGVQASEPAVGSVGREVAGDQFQAQQFDVIAAKDRVLSAECLEDAQQTRILEPVLCGNVPGPVPRVGILGFPDRGVPEWDGGLRVARALQR